MCWVGIEERGDIEVFGGKVGGVGVPVVGPVYFGVAVEYVEAGGGSVEC